MIVTTAAVDQRAMAIKLIEHPEPAFASIPAFASEAHLTGGSAICQSRSRRVVAQYTCVRMQFPDVSTFDNPADPRKTRRNSVKSDGAADGWRGLPILATLLLLQPVVFFVACDDTNRHRSAIMRRTTRRLGRRGQKEDAAAGAATTDAEPGRRQRQRHRGNTGTGGTPARTPGDAGKDAGKDAARTTESVGAVFAFQRVDGLVARGDRNLAQPFEGARVVEPCQGRSGPPRCPSRACRYRCRGARARHSTSA